MKENIEYRIINQLKGYNFVEYTVCQLHGFFHRHLPVNILNPIPYRIPHTVRSNDQIPMVLFIQLDGEDMGFNGKKRAVRTISERARKSKLTEKSFVFNPSANRQDSLSLCIVRHSMIVCGWDCVALFLFQ